MCAGSGEGAAVQLSCARRETSLRAGDPQGLSRKDIIELACQSMNGMTLQARSVLGDGACGDLVELALDVTGGLVLAQLRDAALVALFGREFFGEERFNDLQGFFLGVLTTADRYDLRIVVVASESGPCRGSRPVRRGCPAFLLAAICSPLPDPPSTMPRESRPWSRSCFTARAAWMAAGAVVGGALPPSGPWNHHVVAGGGQLIDEVVGQFETCVVGGDVHAHERGFSWIRCGTGGVLPGIRRGQSDTHHRTVGPGNHPDQRDHSPRRDPGRRPAIMARCSRA